MPYMAQSLQGVVCVCRLRCLLQSRSYVPVHLAPGAYLYDPIALLYDDETDPSRLLLLVRGALL